MVKERFAAVIQKITVLDITKNKIREETYAGLIDLIIVKDEVLRE